MERPSITCLSYSLARLVPHTTMLPFHSRYITSSSPAFIAVSTLTVLLCTLVVPVNALEPRGTGFASIGYFPNWSIYSMNFQPTQIIPSQYTHLLYSFADTSIDTGAIHLTDPWSDEQKHFPGDSWGESGNNLYGCLKQLYLLKLENRNLKVLLSIGGWTYSQSGHFSFVTSATKRARFVSDAVTLVQDYGFDGIDIDFEYPISSAQGVGFANLVTELRTALTRLASKNGDTIPYQISAAVAGGAENYKYLVIPQMNEALDFWNLMAYDYAGSWLTYVDHHANIYGGERTGVSTDAAVKYYIGAGVTASKITMGIPMYGRGFAHTDGLGQSYNGVTGDTDTGFHYYKNLPRPGAKVYENKTDGASYSYDSSKREFVSYDSPDIVKTKAEYIKAEGLGGSMYWEVSLDKVGSGSLADTANNVLKSLDTTKNHINYPNSKWDNVKHNMGSKKRDPTSTTSDDGCTPTGTGTGTSTSGRSTSSSSTRSSSSSGSGTSSGGSSSTRSSSSSGTASTTSSSGSTTTTTGTSSSSGSTSTTTTSTTTTSSSTGSSTTTTTTTTTSDKSTPSTAPWSSTVIYTKGMKCSYIGKIWTSKWWTRGDKPGSSDVWMDSSSSDDDIPAWSSTASYREGTKVSHNNHIWTARWWTRGDTPGSAYVWNDTTPVTSTSTTATTTSGGSTPTNGCGGGVEAWSSTAIYTIDMKVSYEDHLWTAKWWTRGQTPGANRVWKDVGVC